MLAWLLGWVWWLLVPVRRRLATENFRRCFPEEPVGPSLRRGVGEMAAQYVHLFLGRRCASIENLELAEGGALCLAGHFGGWEVGLVSMASLAPMTVFIKEPSGALSRAAVARLRSQARDLELLVAGDSPRRAIRALQRGRLVVLVQDQRYNDGLEVDFFGRPCKTSPAFGVMARLTGARLLGMEQWVEPGGVYRGRLIALSSPDPMPADRDEAIRELTVLSQRFYEDIIRERPWSWLWLHNRWRR